MYENNQITWLFNQNFILRTNYLVIQPKCLSFLTKEMAPKQLICNPDTSKHGQIDKSGIPSPPSKAGGFLVTTS